MPLSLGGGGKGKASSFCNRLAALQGGRGGGKREEGENSMVAIHLRKEGGGRGEGKKGGVLQFWSDLKDLEGGGEKGRKVVDFRHASSQLLSDALEISSHQKKKEEKGRKGKKKMKNLSCPDHSQAKEENGGGERSATN